MLSRRKARKASRVRTATPRLRPAVESCERRQLLATVTPFIQGSAYVDADADGARETSEVGLANATVKLLAPGGAQVAATTTGADGGYLFSGSYLTPGTTYTLVETPPANYVNTGAQALSQLDPASVLSPSTIQVTVVDPNAVTASFLGAVGPFDDIFYTLNGSATRSTAPTPLTFALTADGAPLASSPITTFCVGLTDDLSDNRPFATVVAPQSALPNGGQIAYLDNHHGLALPPTDQLPAAVQSLSLKNIEAGLQVAIWELEYGSSLTLIGPNAAFGTTAQDFADLTTAAAAFVADSAGKSEKVAILDASLTGTLPTPTVTPGGQSILAAQSFNFGNKPSELRPHTALVQGQTATIGFWHNNNGQALIKSLNGGPTATGLSSWLVASFTNLYGPTAGSNNLTGDTNAQVAAYFLTLFNQTGTKTAAQVLGTAFAVYATNSSLAGGSVAAQYGFTVNGQGTGNSTFDVDKSIAAYGGPTGKVDILTLLTFANARSKNGVIGASDSNLPGLFNTIFDGINQGGDIKS